MRMCVLAALALMLAGCATPEMAATTGAGQQQATTEREAPVPPALRTPRQRSGVGWPDLGYRPYGR
jgi:hypothetical protein